jgi:hypothetical protein
MLPVAGTNANTAASGLPPLATVLPSVERRTTFFDRFAHAMKSLAARLLHTPMRLVCSKPFVSANGTVSSMTPADVSCARTDSSITLAESAALGLESAALGFALAAALGFAGGVGGDCLPPPTSRRSSASSFEARMVVASRGRPLKTDSGRG